MKNIKIKLIVIIALIALGCSKEVIKPNKECNCGLVVSDNVQDYSVVIRNSCSGNEKRFYLQEGDWMNAHPGDDYCITNVSNW
jgi:hypothetical protein